MKTTGVLASFLFAGLAAAQPFHQHQHHQHHQKRAVATAYETVTETVIVWTTVYDGVVEEPTSAPAATTTKAAAFFEQSPTSKKEEPKPTSQYTPPPPPPPPAPTSTTSIYTPPPAPTSSKPATSQGPPPPPPPPPAAPTSETPKEQPTTVQKPAATSAAPVQSSPAAAPSQKPSNGGGNGKKYTGDMTVYDSVGTGSCGTTLTANSRVVALAAPTYGQSTYDVMTGQATNPWCGKTITISYGGKTTTAVVADRCPVCAAGDIDVSWPVWNELTNNHAGDRFKAEWWVNE